MASIESLVSSIARLADSSAGDMQALLVSHADGNPPPQMASAFSALEALQTSFVQLRASVRDAETRATATSEALSNALRTAVTEALEACHGQAAALFKQLMRLSIDNMDHTNERFWTVLNVFVGAHVKLFTCYAGIIQLYVLLFVICIVVILSGTFRLSMCYHCTKRLLLGQPPQSRMSAYTPSSRKKSFTKPVTPSLSPRMHRTFSQRMSRTLRCRIVRGKMQTCLPATTCRRPTKPTSCSYQTASKSPLHPIGSHLIMASVAPAPAPARPSEHGPSSRPP